MSDVVFRFRNLEALLDGHHELERLEIFLAPWQDLNDPMEGLHDVFWSGDEILWENLLRQYVLALMMGVTMAMLEDADPFVAPPIAARMTPSDLPTDAIRGVHRNAYEQFSDATGGDALPKRLAAAAHPLRADAMKVLLTLLHPPALDAVGQAMVDAGLLAGPWERTDRDARAVALDGFVDALATEEAPLGEPPMEGLSWFLQQRGEWGAIQQAATLDPGQGGANIDRSHFLWVVFPHAYVDAIAEELLFPEWRVGCFAATCKNPSMWATYADGHAGAALMLRVDGRLTDSAKLHLNAVIGMRGNAPLRRDITVRLWRVRYGDRPPAIDFFKHISTIPRPKIIEGWHSSPSGSVSPLVEELQLNEDAWRQQLDMFLTRLTTTKMAEWAHEDEYRIVFEDWLGMRREYPVVKFDAATLPGVVFGIRTTRSNKVRIVRTLRDFHARALADDFAFYQMVYSPNRAGLEMVKLGSLQDLVDAGAPSDDGADDSGDGAS